MSHAATFKPLHAHRAAAEDIPPLAKMHYVIIVTALLALALAYIIFRGISGSIDNQPAEPQQNSNSTSQGTTGDTGAPTHPSGTATDRTQPNPAGADGNTLLNPEF